MSYTQFLEILPYRRRQRDRFCIQVLQLDQTLDIPEHGIREPLCQPAGLAVEVAYLLELGDGCLPVSISFCRTLASSRPALGAWDETTVQVLGNKNINHEKDTPYGSTIHHKHFFIIGPKSCKRRVCRLASSANSTLAEFRIKRKKAIDKYDLISKLKANKKLSDEDREITIYLLSSIKKSRENINYMLIFTLSIVAILMDLFLSMYFV